MFVDVSAKTHAEPRRAARGHPAGRRGRGAQGQPGHRGVRRGHRVQARPGPRRRRHRARPARHAEGRRRARRRRPLGPRPRDVRLQGHARQARPARPSRSRCSASTPSPRPASSCAWSRTTARRAQLAGERANRLKLEQQARRGGRKVSLETIFDQQRGARSRSSRSCSRRTCPARSRRSRTRSPSCRRTRSRCRSCSPASAASPSPTSTWPPPPTRSCSASTSARSATPRQLADREGVEIRTYSVIYRAIDELRDAMQGMLAPEEVEETVGTRRGARRSSAPRKIGIDRRLHGHRRQGHARRQGAPGPRRRGRLRRRDRLAAALQRRRARGPDGLRVRHRARQLPDVKEGDMIEVYETRQVERTLS